MTGLPVARSGVKLFGLLNIKYGGGLPHHEMLECVSSLLEVDAKIVHNCDVIVQFIGRGYVGKPAAFPAFREVDPTASCGSHSKRWRETAKREGRRRQLGSEDRGRRGKEAGLHPVVYVWGRARADVDGMNGHGKLTPLNDGSVGPNLRRVRKDVGSTLRAKGQVYFLAAKKT